MSDVCAADVKVHLLQPCALASLFIGSLHLLLLRPASHFYSIFCFSSPSYRVVQLFVHFFPTVWALTDRPQYANEGQSPVECTLPVRTCPPILLPDHSFDSIFAFLAGENDSFILIDSYAHIVFINDLDALKLLQFQLTLYRSIALKELYKFAFGCALIGGSVWQQIREVRAGVSAPVRVISNFVSLRANASPDRVGLKRFSIDPFTIYQLVYN